MQHDTSSEGSFLRWRSDGTWRSDETLNTGPGLKIERRIHLLGKGFSDALIQLKASQPCPWCTSPLEVETATEDVRSQPLPPSSKYWATLVQCLTCGWYWERAARYSYLVHAEYENFDRYAQLCGFLGTDDQYALICELESYLKSHVSDVSSLPWRRFEELLENLFRCLGFRVRLTQSTRDGGTDLILLDDGGGTQALVEAKRYAANHRVGVGLVRNLVGAQFDHSVPRAFLVATTEFTSEAKEFAKRQNTQGGFGIRLEIELWGSARLLNEIGCLNERIVRLDSLDRARPLLDQIQGCFKSRRRVLQIPSGFESRHGPLSFIPDADNS
jgi:hypothetical protein